jgi:hypothetical protein
MTCTKDALASAATCFKNSIFSKHDQDALIVYLLAYILNAKAGTNYLSSLTTTLMSNAVAFSEMEDDQRKAAFISILNTYTQVTPTGIALADLVTAIACLKNATQDQLDQCKLLLACELSNVLV